MKALVTGGAGFIGSNIVEMLIEKGGDVTVFDNLSSGYLCNIEHYIKNGEIEFINGDVRESESVSKACKGKDMVFHLAACVGRKKSIDNPKLDSSTNLLGTINVLEGMKKNNVPRIVYSSSAAIFGEPLSSTVDENHPLNANSPYGVSKLAAEKMILVYSGTYGITGACIRYFNIYGRNQRFDLYGNVIPIFAKRIFSGHPMTIYGDGAQTRDFVCVSDVVAVNLIASKIERGMNVYNLGSGSSITINELAELMQDISGEHVGVGYAPERIADVKNCRADISKIEKELGFKAAMGIKQGLTDYLRWYQNNCAD